jgi:hypothetical protein
VELVSPVVELGVLEVVIADTLAMEAEYKEQIAINTYPAYASSIIFVEHAVFIQGSTVA